MTILGVDPGFRFAGYGILKKKDRQAFLLDYGYLSLRATEPLSVRLGIFFDFFYQKIETHQITHLALETPFLGKNAQNFLKLGYLRGALYLLADKHGLQLSEFSPREVKQAVTGFGGAGKDQVARIIKQFFPTISPQKEDVTDALAVTLCCLWRNPTLHAG